MMEGRTLQKQLEHLSARRRTYDDESIARSFAKLMFEGKVHAALRYLGDNHSGEFFHWMTA